MVLAAGLGTRLRPLTDAVPKALVQAGGKPLIAWQLERLARAGFREVVINLAGLGEAIEARLRQSGEKEVDSTWLGEAVMRELRKLDKVAYVRFASVYREFKDVSQFLEELKPMLEKRREGEDETADGTSG